MEKCDYLVLGGGPAGLAFACHLLELTEGKASILVLEKEKEAGGLCRSTMVDGAPLDIGGGHFLDVKRPKVNEFLFRYMPEEEWTKYDRDSRISLHGQMISYPIEANIWQLPLDDQVAYLKSIAIAGCNVGKPMPKEFVEWIEWKLGSKIAEEYMLPYNRKMYGQELSQLGTYWMEKLPQVSFEETLLSCLQKKAYGTNPGHTHFYYPKRYGYGELWKRMAQSIDMHMRYEAEVVNLDLDTKVVQCRDGRSFQGEQIVTTIPWTCFAFIEGLDEGKKNGLQKLKHTGVAIQYQPEKLDTQAQWIYYPDEGISFHRILVRHNFCPKSRGYWTETNLDRYSRREENGFINEYAYPLNTIDKPYIMKELLSETAHKRVYGLGRWGEHQHFNSDVVVERAMVLAESMHSGEGRK